MVDKQDLINGEVVGLVIFGKRLFVVDFLYLLNIVFSFLIIELMELYVKCLG